MRCAHYTRARTHRCCELDPETSSSLSFSFVYIPIDLFTAPRDIRAFFPADCTRFVLFIARRALSLYINAGDEGCVVDRCCAAAGVMCSVCALVERVIFGMGLLLTVRMPYVLIIRLIIERCMEALEKKTVLLTSWVFRRGGALALRSSNMVINANEFM